MKTAIIPGINGQDGYYLAKFLLCKGYRVVGLQRRTSSSTAWRLDNLPQKEGLHLVPGDITDMSSIVGAIRQFSPDEFYNLAAQSQVWHSFKSPMATLEITGMGAANCLEAVRQHAPDCRFYQAGSSEQFGNAAIGGRERSEVEDVYQHILNENSPMLPRSPYGCAKLMAYALTKNYREAYGMFAVGGILFNHESPFRGIEFVTRKITDGVAQIAAGKTDHITLGNLDSYRDWGHAQDYMEAAWMMLQQNKPVDYVIATGETHSIRDFLDVAFAKISVQDWSNYVEINPEFVRPSEVDVLIGDASRARSELGWMSQYSFRDLVGEMVTYDCIRHDVVDKITQ